MEVLAYPPGRNYSCGTARDLHPTSSRFVKEQCNHLISNAYHVNDKKIHMENMARLRPRLYFFLVKWMHV
jgi:hypothetical protein